MAHPQSINPIAANSQKHKGEEPLKQTSSPTFEQLLRGEASRWPGPGGIPQMEDDNQPIPNPTPPKKSISVLAKVKEKAKKWRHTLTSSGSSRKKHSDDGNTTPSWGVSLADDDDDDLDPQHLGAPLYESEIGPQGFKETSIKHPKIVPVTPDRGHINGNLSNDIKVSPSPKGINIKEIHASPKPKSKNKKDVQSSPSLMPNNEIQPAPSPKVNKDVQATPSPKGTVDVNVQVSRQQPEGSSPGLVPIQTSQGSSLNTARTLSKTMADKLGPAYTTVSDATYVLASKLHNLALSKQEPLKPGTGTPKSAPGKISLSPTVKSSRPGLPTIATKQPEFPTKDDQKSPPGSAPAAVEASSYMPSAGKHLWDKGVSVKEYILQKFEPGEDEKALSQVISKAISPKKKDEDPTVVEKVREAVTSLLQNQQSSSSSSQPNCSAYHSAQNSSTQIPHVAITNEVTEAETLERLLQSN
ncbi:hypothetical protein M5689_002704 [Euphorbia peplus]|nr:hypothetical protein M5689_002704 [Euphorbia peplus]